MHLLLRLWLGAGNALVRADVQTLQRHRDETDRLCLGQRRCEVKLVSAGPCEHGCENEAPKGQRFCSDGCDRCEHESKGKNGCDGICREDRP